MLAAKQKELDKLLRLDADQAWWFRVREFSLVKGLNPNYVDPGTLVATIHRSAYDGETGVLKWCLETGADVNAKTSLGRTPLHQACMGNRPLCVRRLIAEGADVMSATNASWTPLHFCCHYQSYEALQALLAGATAFRKIIDVEAVNMRGAPPQALTDEKLILHAIDEYNVSLHEQKKWIALESIPII